jgi:prepilin-type N-terminal cleavage/methylation domain-containing protein
MRPKLQVTSYKLQVSRRNQATRETFSFQLSTFNRFRAFTLVELLVVISILGILAALVVPAIKNFGHSDATISASRQLLDDIARARQLAISQRTTVYMVFVPTNFWNNPVYNTAAASTAWWGNLMPAQQTAATNLCDKQLTGYTFIAKGAMGDQPGNHQWHYLASWQTLPDNTFIAASKFAAPGSSFTIPAYDPTISIYAFTSMAVPFPTETNDNFISMPCITFNYQGQLTTNGVDVAAAHEYIPLARGSVLPAINPATRAYQLNSPSVSENPSGNSTNAYNIIDIEPLTGRAVLEYQKVK